MANSNSKTGLLRLKSHTYTKKMIFDKIEIMDKFNSEFYIGP